MIILLQIMRCVIKIHACYLLSVQERLIFMNQTYKKTGYLLDDFRLFHLNEKQKGTMEYHYHDFYKLFILKSGNGNYSIDGQRYTLTDGDLVFIGKQQIHRPEFDSDFAYERIIIYIDPDFLNGHSDTDCDFKNIFDGTWGHVLRLSQIQRKIIFDLISLLEDELENNHYGRAVMSNAILMQLLLRIARDLQNIDVQMVKPADTMHPRTLELLKYIEEHITEELTIDELADRFFVSKYHMMRSFKEEIGQTIYNYITERRLLFAKSLIHQGVSATESCYQAGFKSYSSFTRAYGKRFGTTPTGRMDRNSKMDETYE